jgi:anaerobic magnesium-protoporphyrin IX monomethyl ester cyclase
MKVSIIQPYFKNIWESVGVGYIVAYCRAHLGDRVEFRVYQENYDPHDFIVNECVGSDIVAFSATSPTYTGALRLAREIKERNPLVWTVLGGWHATAVSPATIDTSHIDQIVRGEGEEPFLRILQGNADPVLVAQRLGFDHLPWPDREAINERRQVDYCELTWGERIASVQSIRGCKMNCKMCAQSCMTGQYRADTNPLRLRPPVDTMNEVEWLIEQYSIERFKFLDPTWAVDDDVVFAFCEEKLRRNCTIKWDAEVHAHFVTKRALEIMSRAGCDVIMVGCESGSPRSLKELKKGATLEEIKRVFSWAREYGMKRRSFFMLGIPGETSGDIRATYTLIKELEPDLFGMTFLTPYPGCAYHDPERHAGVDWSECDEYGNDFWQTENFTNQQLKEIQRWFHFRFWDSLVEHRKRAMTA